MKEWLPGALVTIFATIVAAIIWMPADYFISRQAEVDGARISREEENRTSGSETAETPPIGLFGPLSEERDRQFPDFLSLLEKPRHGSEIMAAVKSLGRFETLRHKDGVELCFTELGIHFVFDQINHLDKVAFYADAPDAHQPFRRRFPLSIKLGFDQTREDAGREIDNHAGRHIDAELGKGEWDKYEMQGYRLYLRFNTFNGREQIREIQLVRRKNELAER